MKKLIISLITILFSVSVYAKDIQELVVTTNPPMSCQNCENKIKKGDLRFLKGVKKIETNLSDQRVTIEYDADKTNVEQIEEAFHKTGYNIEIINPDGAPNEGKTGAPQQASCNSCSGSCCQGGSK